MAKRCKRFAILADASCTLVITIAYAGNRYLNTQIASVVANGNADTSNPGTTCITVTSQLIRM